MNLQKLLTYEVENCPQAYIGFVGTGPALDALVGVFSRNDLSMAFPSVRIAGWVPEPGRPQSENVGAKPYFLDGIPLFSDISSLLASQENMLAVVDFSADSRHARSLRATANEKVSVISSEMVLRFCAAVDDGRVHLGAGEGFSKTQKLVALLVNQIDGDILILDENAVILDINQHAAESKGLTRSQIVGMPCRTLDKNTGFCDCDDENCPFLMAKDTGRQAAHVFTQVLPNGRLRYIDAMCFPVEDPLDSSRQFLYIRRDVTEQHHLEQRLQQSEKMAAIGELSTYMAHEIRNPLFSIGGFANALLRNPSLNDLAREKARIIYDESRRLDIILTSILNFARPTEQSMGIFDIEPVARQTMDLMTIGSDERGIVSIVDIQPDIPKVQGNAENLKQCLINLVKNAIESMPGGGTVTLRVRHTGQYIQVDVEDTGKGVAPELQEKIFSPFFTTKHGGAGLGLAMTRKIIEEMGGKVLFESRVGKGSRVSLLIPVALAVDHEADPGSGAS